ncbi:MAG: cytochrome c3 family protein [Desulfobulbaceae bacterium]|nr:cytochrome c3 family protein [Desulfobulbaceae bacterium]
MKNHVWRPLSVALALVAAILLFRYFYVPKDFGSGKYGFMYSYHRQADEEQWKNMPVRYQNTGGQQMHESCRECHAEEVAGRTKELHGIIACEDCHGPARNHPDDPETLPVDRGRDLCLRCHTSLSYITSDRKRIPGIDAKEHNPGSECVECHNPHNPRLEDMQR